MPEEYKEEFLKKLVKNPSLSGEKKSLDSVMGHPAIWRIFESTEKGFAAIDVDNLSICEYRKGNKKHETLCRNNIRKLILSAKKTKQPKVFRCPGNKYSVILPLIQGDKLFGLIMICNLDESISNKMLSLLAAFTEAIMADVTKELELSKLYETIRPRAIALSTIHTIHRLISSTLKLEELLPRVARLSLQVLRASRASIMLFDEKRKYLLPKTIIDLRSHKTTGRKIKMGEGLEGKVAKDGTAVLKTNVLSVPLMHEEIIGVITIQDKVNKKPFNIFDKEILSTLAEQAVIAIHNAKLYEEQEKITIGSIKSLAAVLDTKSRYTYTHSNIFVKIVLALGRSMNMSDDELRNLHFAALLPDAGKVWVPEEILRKPSKLTKREFKLIKEHPIKSVEILKHIDVLKPTIPIILHHHERYDGTGYPYGLKKDEIPLGARIMSVVDALEAMMFKRPYRAAMTFKQAISEIQKFSGTQFDPLVVKTFMELVRSGKIRQILKEKDHANK